MLDYKYNVPVAIVFFNRPSCLKKVFEAVANAKPSKLFLIQDGAREGNSKDVENIQKCRDIVECVDWDCEVVKIYSDTNLGCGKRVSSGITEAFKTVDRLMILEDDCVPADSFFPFCEELLEKYKDDTRINMISGMNHLGEYDCGGNDYFFCKTGAIWGWATWKRVWDLYDYEMKFMSDKYTMECFEKSLANNIYKKRYMKMGQSRYQDFCAGKRLTAWTYQFGMMRYLFSQLIIVPRVNMVSNIGAGTEATHGKSEIRHEPKQTQRILMMKTHEMAQPYTHPHYVVEDDEYDKKMIKIMGYAWYIKPLRKLERALRRLFIK